MRIYLFSTIPLPPSRAWSEWNILIIPKKEDDVVHLEVMLPDHAPKACEDRGVLWEQIEDQRNAQLARRIILPLPNEVPRDEWEEMVRQYCQEQFISKGMCPDVPIFVQLSPIINFDSTPGLVDKAIRTDMIIDSLV